MWRISLMTAAHGDPLRQSQRRSGSGDARDELYSIDFQAYQMSPTCAVGYRYTQTGESNNGATDEITSMPPGLSIVSDDVERHLHYGSKKEPLKESPPKPSSFKKKAEDMPSRLRQGIRRVASSIGMKFLFTATTDSSDPGPQGLNSQGLNLPVLNPSGLNQPGSNARNSKPRGANARGSNQRGANSRSSNQRGSKSRGTNPANSNPQVSIPIDLQMGGAGEIIENLFCDGSVIADTTTSFHYRWMWVISGAVLYNVIFVIARAVFWELNNSVPYIWLGLDYLSDAIYFIDFILHFHEGYLEQGILQTESSKLRKHYWVTGKWKTDLLSMLPTDIFYYWWPPNSCSKESLPCPVIIRLNRLLRFPRMGEFFDRTEMNTGYPNAFRIYKVIIVILLLIHCNSCLYFIISYYIGFGKDQWVYNDYGEHNSSLSRQYIYSFYWSALTLTTIGETPQPVEEWEYIFTVFDFLAGVLIFATIVGNIGSMISNMNLARVDFQNRIDGIKQYMNFRKVPRDLQDKVIRWFAYTWANKQALDEERVLSGLPDKLKAEIAMHVHLDTLKQVQIFQDCENGLLEELVLKLRLQVFSPGDFIFKKGDVGKEMYIVKRGILNVVAEDGETKKVTLGPGSVFGELSVLEIPGSQSGNRRSASVRSVGYSDLFCLSKRDLWEALIDYPRTRRTLMERGCQLLRKDGLLDENAFKKSQLEHETLKEKVERIEHSLESMQEVLLKFIADNSYCQSKNKRRTSRIEHKKKQGSPTMNTIQEPLTVTEDGSQTMQTVQSMQTFPVSTISFVREKQRTV